MGVDNTQRMVVNALFSPLILRNQMLTLIEENTMKTNEEGNQTIPANNNNNNNNDIIISEPSRESSDKFLINEVSEEKRSSIEDMKRRTHRLKPLLSPMRVPFSPVSNLPHSPLPISPLNRNILITILSNEKHRLKV